MSTRLSEKKPMAYDNCITTERQTLRPNANALVAKRREYEKGKKFIRIPIVKGYILREVK